MIDLQEGVLREFVERAGGIDDEIAELIQHGLLQPVNDRSRSRAREMVDITSSRRRFRGAAGLCRECGTASARYRCTTCAGVHAAKTRASRQAA